MKCTDLSFFIISGLFVLLPNKILFANEAVLSPNKEIQMVETKINSNSINPYDPLPKPEPYPRPMDPREPAPKPEPKPPRPTPDPSCPASGCHGSKGIWDDRRDEDYNRNIFKNSEPYKGDDFMQKVQDAQNRIDMKGTDLKGQSGFGSNY